MKDKPLKTSQPGGAFGMGMLATVAIVLACALGVGQRGDFIALDSLFRRFSPVSGSDEIVHIDIDDGSIEQIGRWPWPRATLAGVIDVLDECGAKMIMLDMILPDYQKIRYEPMEQDPLAEAGAELAWQSVTPIFDDALLADAIGAAQNVAVPMHIDFTQGESGDSPALLGQGDADQQRHQRGLEAMVRFSVPPYRQQGAQLANGPMTPPLVGFTESAGISGFVTFTPEIDGVARRVRLLGRSSGRVYMQIALAMVVEHLAGEHGELAALQAGEQSVTLTFADGTERVIPTNRQGQMFISWRGRSSSGGQHVSISDVELIWRQRQALKRNNNLAMLVVLAVADEVARWEVQDLVEWADKLYIERISLQRRGRLAALNGKAGPGEQLAKVLAEEAQLQRDIDEEAFSLREDLKNTYLTLPWAEDKRERLVQFQAKLVQIDEANALIAADIDTQLKSVRSRVAGRVCMIGSTTTSAADFVPTPLGKRTPGVVVHANVFDTILSGRFIRPARPAVALLIVLVMGAAVSAVSAWRPMLQAALAAAVIAAGYLAFVAWVAFARMGLWLPVVGPLAVVVASYLAVAVFRQLTEQRAKQHIRKMFAHALSPTLVDRLLVDPSLAELGGQRRQISCMFSDLAGFTAMSERLGPQRTVGLLNRYFNGATDVIQNIHEGYLNKFLGDGIFCFFGAPVYQPDHAARALRAAVDCHRKAAQLNVELAEEFGEAAKLKVRVGITVGEAMVGNCGSSDRMDYTAIGDCVNLASRLESANKLLGTDIIVTDEAWELAGEATDMHARYIGRAIISGFAEPIRLQQVLTDEQLSPERETWLMYFARAVELFEAGEFAQAIERFIAAGEIEADDPLNTIYQRLCSYAIERVAGEPWQPPSQTADGVVSIAPPPAIGDYA